MVLLNPLFEVSPEEGELWAMVEIPGWIPLTKMLSVACPKAPHHLPPPCVRRRSRTGLMHHLNTILGSWYLVRVKGTTVIRDRAWSVPWEHRMEGAPPKHSSPFPRLLKGLTASPDTSSTNPSQTGQTIQVPGDHKIQQAQEYPPHLCPLQTSIYLCRSSQTLQTVGTFHSHL